MKYIKAKDRDFTFDEDQLEELKAYYRFNLEEEKELFEGYIKDGFMTKKEAKDRFLEVKEFNKELDRCNNIFEAAEFLNSRRDFADIYEEFVIKEYDF